MEPDQITLRKIMLVKQIYTEAIRESYAGQSMVKRIIAVLGFDLSVETALKTVITSIDPSKTLADGFQSLLQQCDTLLISADLDALPDRANIIHVHAIRNDAQHRGRYPNEDELNDCRVYARDFLRKVIASVWDLDVDAVTLTDLIANTQAKQYLADAEASISQGEFRSAVNSAAIGLEYALMKSEHAVVGPRPSMWPKAMLLVDSFGRASNESDGREAYLTFTRMYDSLLFLTLGIDFAAYLRLHAMAGAITFSINGTPFIHGNQSEVDLEDAEFAVAFATSSIIQIEATVQDIDRPFGRTPYS